ncbi:RNA polymerase-binding transcription factor CarD [compost metagenome]
MINVGAKIFYPNQGAGFIESVEYHRFSGTTRKYLKIFIPWSRLILYLPVNNEEKMTIRPISTTNELKEARKQFLDVPAKLLTNSTERKIMLKNKLMSGKTTELIQIIRDINCCKLLGIKTTRDDRYILDDAVVLLESEMMMTNEISLEGARLLMKDDMRQLHSLVTH